MAVTGPYSVTLEVPDLRRGVEFYKDAGLDARVEDGRAYLSCIDDDHACIVLIGSAPRKRLHHLALRADPARIDGARNRVEEHGGKLISAPPGCKEAGLWLEDPHGTVLRLVPAGPERELPAVEPFAINEPGRIVRRNQSGIPAKASIRPVLPLRLGHVLLYTPDVHVSVEFFTHVLDMRLSDYSEDAVAFMCARFESDHHVVAFAKSPGTGFHHASFQVATPDDVGRGGRELADKSKRGDWGFGRHTIGANFFHYIQDPWGSWFEYFADMDYISDAADWRPTNYASQDSLYNWGPEVPHDFVHNYEADDIEQIKALGF